MVLGGREGGRAGTYLHAILPTPSFQLHQQRFPALVLATRRQGNVSPTHSDGCTSLAIVLSDGRAHHLEPHLQKGEREGGREGGSERGVGESSFTSTRKKEEKYFLYTQ